MQCLLNNCKWITVLGVIFLAVGAAIVLSNYFSPKTSSSSNLKVVFLADRPELVTNLGNWTYNKWKSYDPTLTLESSIKKYQEKLNRNKVPFVLLLLDNNNPIGMVSLNEQEPIEEFKDKSPWIGDFYILPEYDDENIKMRQYLMRNLKGVAENLKYSKLFVFTSDPSRVDWYMRLGWKILKTSSFQNHLVTVMEFDVNQDH